MYWGVLGAGPSLRSEFPFLGLPRPSRAFCERVGLGWKLKFLPMGPKPFRYRHQRCLLFIISSCYGESRHWILSEPPRPSSARFFNHALQSGGAPVCYSVMPAITESRKSAVRHPVQRGRRAQRLPLHSAQRPSPLMKADPVRWQSPDPFQDSKGETSDKP